MITRKPYISWLLALLLLGAAPIASCQSIITPHQAPAPSLPLGAATAALLTQITSLSAKIAQIQAALDPTPFGQPYVNLTGKLAVCHFQGSCRAWQNGSVAGYVAAETKARAMGFDAFSIDLGAYDGNYQQNMDNMYAACNQMRIANNGAVNNKGVGDFKLFITLDLATFTYTQAAILPVLTKYLADPSNLIYKGRPLYSTYTGGSFGTQNNLKSFWVSINAALTAANTAPCFIPGFETTDANCNSIPNTPANCAAMAAYLKTFADGWWKYTVGSAITQDSPLAGDESRSAATRSAGLTVMTSQIGAYWFSAHSQATDGHDHFYQEYYGGESLAAGWKSVLTNQRPDILQFLTWNDYDEGSNIDDQSVGAGSAWPYLFHSAVSGYYKSKAGLVTEWQIGLHEFKTGLPPKLTNDWIVPFYRTQTAACTYTLKLDGTMLDPLGPIAYVTDEQGNPGALHDVACITCLLRQSGKLVWACGGQTATRYVPAGISRLRVPYVAGQPVLSFTGADGTTLSVPGLEPIVSTADYVNANYFTQAAHD